MRWLNSGRGRYATFAARINGGGEIVGDREDESDNYPVIWSRHPMRNLPKLLLDGDAVAVDRSGLIAGESTAHGFHLATLWRGRKALALGNLQTANELRYGIGGAATASSASGVNDRGQVVGWACGDNPYQTYAVMWSPRTREPS